VMIPPSNTTTWSLSIRPERTSSSFPQWTAPGAANDMRLTQKTNATQTAALLFNGVVSLCEEVDKDYKVCTSKSASIIDLIFCEYAIDPKSRR
jgi:hypothetical protein